MRISWSVQLQHGATPLPAASPLSLGPTKQTSEKVGRTRKQQIKRETRETKGEEEEEVEEAAGGGGGGMTSTSTKAKLGLTTLPGFNLLPDSVKTTLRSVATTTRGTKKEQEREGNEWSNKKENARNRGK